MSKAKECYSLHALNCVSRIKTLPMEGQRRRTMFELGDSPDGDSGVVAQRYGAGVSWWCSLPHHVLTGSLSPYLCRRGISSTSCGHSGGTRKWSWNWHIQRVFHRSTPIQLGPIRLAFVCQRSYKHTTCIAYSVAVQDTFFLDLVLWPMKKVWMPLTKVK